MAKDNAYRRAEEKIAEAQKTRAEYLDLSLLNLSEIPEALAALTWLRELDISGNKFATLPGLLRQLRELRTLNVTGNGLVALPDFLGEFYRLEKLHLGANALTEMPASLGHLTELRELVITRNPLGTVPEPLSRLTQLERLFIYDCGLTALPDFLGQFSRLHTLSISGNPLGRLPPVIRKLNSLRTLFAGHIGLRVLPKEMEAYANITSLSLSGNELSGLPDRIDRLGFLTFLNLENNRLTTLPSGLQQLRHLEQLYLHGNPDLGLPEDVLGPRAIDVNQKNRPKLPAEILDYYFALQGTGVALREMKLIVVGWGKAGKTTLVKRLAGSPMDPTEPETHGIMIHPLTLQCTDGELRARVWDFGGQHVLHAMHEFFLTARSLYLLVVEQRGDRAETEAKYWLQLIRSYAPEAPVVVALTKSRGVERPLDRESLEKQYGPIVAWVPTECLAEVECAGAEATIEKLRAALTRAGEAPTMPEPRKLFPRKWVAIKRWLEDLDQTGINFLDYEAFAQGCAERGEPDPAKQAEVAALMHDLGIAMNYARDERLRDTTVLRPDWLANGIYAALRANLLLPSQPLAPDAVLTAEKLGEIYATAGAKSVGMLKAEDYPQEKWEFLLRLMNLFQLSFPLNPEGTRQLCPALLQAEPPPDTDEPAGEADRLRYEFTVVPAPLLPRFIVRTFSLIAPGKLWQRGAILRYAEARARVWTTAEEKYLFVTVAGPEKRDRDELLAIVRETLTELFREYRNLQVTEQHRFKNEWVPRQTLELFGVLPREGGAETDSKEEETP